MESIFSYSCRGNQSSSQQRYHTRKDRSRKRQRRNAVGLPKARANATSNTVVHLAAHTKPPLDGPACTTPTSLRCEVGVTRLTPGAHGLNQLHVRRGERKRIAEKYMKPPSRQATIFVPPVNGRILTLPPITNQSERGLYAASSCSRRRGHRFVPAARTLKRPEGRAPGAGSRCAPVNSARSCGHFLGTRQRKTSTPAPPPTPARPRIATSSPPRPAGKTGTTSPCRDTRRDCPRPAPH